MAADCLQQRAERLGATTWIGGPPVLFERIGSLGFQLLLREGLRPSSRVLDVGCGALRLGYWLMRFLEPGHYFGIEPQEHLVKIGLEELIEPEIVQRADAHFNNNEEFDFSVFGEQFDFALARSIWTHASKSQISAMLSSFAANSSQSGVFLASYIPASVVARLGRTLPPLEKITSSLSLAAHLPGLAQRWPTIGPSRDYLGDSWIGRDRTSKESGMVGHRFSWIADEAQRNGLTVRQLPYAVANHQYWLRIAHA